MSSSGYDMAVLAYFETMLTKSIVKPSMSADFFVIDGTSLNISFQLKTIYQISALS